MNRPVSSSEIVSKPHFFTEQTVRRHRCALERSSEFLFGMEKNQAWSTATYRRSTLDMIVLQEPPEAVRRFFTQLDTWTRGQVTIARMERGVVACLPSVLAWLDRIDLSPSEHESRQGGRSTCSSDILLCNAWMESEQYIMETDAYVAKRLGDDAALLFSNIRLAIDDLWLRRYFYRVLIGTQSRDRRHLPEAEWQYLIEQLWATAHAAAGLIYGMLSEAAAIPMSEGAGEIDTVRREISEEDRRWLRDASNDPVL